MKSLDGALIVGSVREKIRLNLIRSTALSGVLAGLALAPIPALAQTAPGQSAAEDATEEEIVVTGSRIVREGYEAPTPLTVVGAEQLQGAADANLMNFLQTMPAITGSTTNTSTSTALANGGAGLQTLNLRGLGGNRVLVLLDGQRTVGSSTQGTVDVASFPSHLVSRVDVVTGGASAVYGSDAVAGVVNFILDRNFTGIKAEVSGGLTNYGDDKNYKIDVSAGFGFAGGRGHVLLSGQHLFNEGIKGDGGRAWNRKGYQQIVNPNYTATNGQPQQLVLFDVGPAVMTPGGLIVSGPLKGTAFGEGGTPFQYRYGAIFSSPYMQGGDWALGDLRPFNDIDQRQENDSTFTRVSYDLADNFSAFVQWGWTQAKIENEIAPSWFFGSATSPTIRIDNAFLPASVRAAMTANNITSFQLGTTNQDHFLKLGNKGSRMTNRFNTGLEGSFNAFGGDWNWDAYFAKGATKISFGSPASIITANYRLALDSVVHPTTGQIVCRVALTDPGTACRPWNVIGTGVNAGNAAGWNYINGDGSSQKGTIEQTTFAAEITGEPFDLPAGPVSLALSIEHRKDEVNVVADTLSTTGGHLLGNVPGLVGAQSVTEGAVETVIPVVNGASWAQSWDINAAVRATDYELSGYVTTWKIGTTWAPIDDVRFRLTRSRDIRAPNLFELFTPVQIGSAQPQIIDRFLPGAPQYALGTTNTTGNLDLLPEKADTTGIGVVFSPQFAPGFTASVDFWDVNIKGAILPLTVQQVIDSCFNGEIPAVCPNIIRDPATGNIRQIRLYSINLATQNVRGLDLEASYRTPLSAIVSDWAGAISLHGNMTLYFKNYQDNTFNKPTNRVGENNGATPPDWRLTANASYALDPISVTLTARAVSKGLLNATYIECTSGCPAATIDNPTVNDNSVPGAVYLDANITYKFAMGEEAEGEFFIAAKNLFNRDPPPLVTSYFANSASTGTLFDPLGTVYRAGFRFRM